MRFDLLGGERVKMSNKLIKEKDLEAKRIRRKRIKKKSK